MLLNFTVENCLSFRQSQEFTMLRKRRRQQGGWNERVSPVAAIYGGNASGKTNLLRCMNFFSNFVRDSFRNVRDGINTQPFLLDGTSERQPSTMYAEFVADDGNRYEYWFRVDAEMVLEEVLWLYRKETGRKTVVFERELGHDTKFGPRFRHMGLIARLTRGNSLLLSVAAASGIEEIMPAYREIVDRIRYFGPIDFQRSIGSFVHRIRENPQKARRLARLISYADLGISDVDFEEKNAPQELVKLLQKLDISLGEDSEEGDSSASQTESSVSYKIPHVLFSHQGNGTVRQLSEQWESEGTKNALILLSRVLDSLAEPSITLLDEPDSSISVNLLAEIIGLYQDPQTNPHHSQLIFTTHDIALISASGADERVLDRDQIWIVDKERSTGESSLNWLMDWSPRENENFGRNYQHGVYAGPAAPNFHDVVKGFFDSSDGTDGSDGDGEGGGKRTD